MTSTRAGGPTGWTSSAVFELRLSHEANKFYQKLPPKRARQLNRALESLSRDPLAGPQLKRLHGPLEGSWRYRVGDLRIIYRVDLTARIVWVETIGPRGSVY